MPTHPTIEPLEIRLTEGSAIVLRGLSGEEWDPAVLKGEVVLNLEKESILREISLVFTGNAHVAWKDANSHHHVHPLFYHDFAFLNPCSSSTPHATPKIAHTLSAGHHVFPFTLSIPGSLPASGRYKHALVGYKLKATATRPAFTADWKARRIIQVSRGFGVDAVEYNQTLEIENTWPGKVSYALTLPYKAFAAGTSIPVSVRFSPLAKGVRVLSLLSTIREHVVVHSKTSSHAEATDATSVSYSFLREEFDATASSHHTSSVSTPQDGQEQIASGSNWSSSLQRAAQDSLPSGSAQVGPIAAADDDGVDTEIDIVVEIPIPPFTTPSHHVHPIFVSHKLKWSAFIRNPDGHVSELRCALPIHILARSLAEEASLASSGSRNLLFGESGVLAHTDVPQVDLPSYQDHVMDRVANAETASYFSLAAGFTATAWSSRSAPGTPGFGTPFSSPPHSRPASPTGRHSAPFGLSSRPSLSISGRHSGDVSPGTPTSPVNDDEQDHRNWIDSELMGTLHISPPGSTPNSRPGSVAGSRPSSRPASPDHSPHHSQEHSQEHSPAGSLPASSAPFHDPPPLASRQSSSGSSFFHLHMPKPLRPLTAFSRTASASAVPSLSHPHSSSRHPTPSALSHALAAHAAKGQYARNHSTDANAIHTHSAMSNSPNDVLSASASLSSSPGTSFSPLTAFPPLLPLVASTTAPAAKTPTPPQDGVDVDYLSQVPSYDVARRGFLGGGVTPLSTLPPEF